MWLYPSPGHVFFTEKGKNNVWQMAGFWETWPSPSLILIPTIWMPSSAFCHLPIYSPTLFSNKIISLPLPTSLATQSYQSLGPILRSPPPRPEHFVFPQPRFTHFILTINHFITFPACVCLHIFCFECVNFVNYTKLLDCFLNFPSPRLWVLKNLRGCDPQGRVYY